VLPPIVDYVPKNLSNPFDEIERLPEDEADHKALMNKAFDYGFDHIADQLSKFRKACRKNDVQTQYSQGTHVAFVMTLAWLWTETQQLLKFAREQRLELEARVAALESLPKMQHRGIWEKDTLYPPATFITCDGSTWYSDVESVGVKPGSGNAVWRLTAKRGKDAR